MTTTARMINAGWVSFHGWTHSRTSHARGTNLTSSWKPPRTGNVPGSLLPQYKKPMWARPCQKMRLQGWSQEQSSRPQIKRDIGIKLLRATRQKYFDYKSTWSKREHPKMKWISSQKSQGTSPISRLSQMPLLLHTGHCLTTWSGKSLKVKRL